MSAVDPYALQIMSNMFYHITIPFIQVSRYCFLLDEFLMLYVVPAVPWFKYLGVRQLAPRDVILK